MGQCASRKQFNASVNNGMTILNNTIISELITESEQILRKSNTKIAIHKNKENQDIYRRVLKHLANCGSKQYELNKITAKNIVNTVNYIEIQNGLPHAKVFIKKQAVKNMINAARKKLVKNQKN